MKPKDYGKLAPKTEYLETYKATYLLDTISDPRFRSAMNHAWADWTLGLSDSAAHFKIAGAKSFIEHFLSFGIPVSDDKKPDPAELETELP